MQPWIGKHFTIPTGLALDAFRLRMLTVNDVVKDYDAVMVSRADIRGVFGPTDDWPEENLSLEQDLIDLGWHQKEFQRRSSFAYTVMSLDETRCLGYVYIYPSEREDFDAMVILWARTGSGIDQALYTAVKTWLARDWPFQRVAYPGRDIDWHDWLTKPKG